MPEMPSWRAASMIEGQREAGIDPLRFQSEMRAGYSKPKRRDIWLGPPKAVTMSSIVFMEPKLRDLRYAVNARCVAGSATLPAMSEIDRRLRAAREKAGYETATDAARRFKWPVSTYLGHENGDRTPKRKTAEKYAKAFRVPLTWLLDLSDAVPSYRVPVWGHVGLGETVTLTEGQDTPLEYIDIPIDFRVDCGALIARGNSQYPRVQDGDVVIFYRNGTEPDTQIGEECIVGLPTGEIYLKKLRVGSKAGLYNLESHNAPTMRDQAVEWVGPVLAILPPGRWKMIRNA